MLHSKRDVLNNCTAVEEQQNRKKKEAENTPTELKIEKQQNESSPKLENLTSFFARLPTAKMNLVVFLPLKWLDDSKFKSSVEIN